MQNTISKLQQLLEFKLKNPDASVREIARAVGISKSAVDRMLKKRSTQELLKDIEKEIKNELVIVQMEALAGMRQLMNDPKVSPGVRAGLFKFVLQNHITAQGEREPDTLVFETVIADNGQMEQIKYTDFT